MSRRGLIHRILYILLPDPHWTNYCLWKASRQKSSIGEDRRKMRALSASAKSTTSPLTAFYEHSQRNKQLVIEHIPPATYIKPGDAPWYLDTSIKLKNKYGEQCDALDADECFCRECNETTAYIRYGVYSMRVRADTVLGDWITKFGDAWGITTNSVPYAKRGAERARLGNTYVIRARDQIEFYRPLGEPDPSWTPPGARKAMRDYQRALERTRSPRTR